MISSKLLTSELLGYRATIPVFVRTLVRIIPVPHSGYLIDTSAEPNTGGSVHKQESIVSYTLGLKLRHEVQYRYTTTAILPATVFIIILMFLGYGLTRDPRIIPSPLIGKPVPEFTLPVLPGR